MKTVTISLGGIAILSTIVFAGGSYKSHKVNEEAQKILADMRDSGVNIQYSDVTARVWSDSATFSDITLMDDGSSEPILHADSITFTSLSSIQAKSYGDMTSSGVVVDGLRYSPSLTEILMQEAEAYYNAGVGGINLFVEPEKYSDFVSTLLSKDVNLSYVESSKDSELPSLADYYPLSTKTSMTHNDLYSVSVNLDMYVPVTEADAYGEMSIVDQWGIQSETHINDMMENGLIKGFSLKFEDKGLVKKVDDTLPGIKAMVSNMLKASGAEFYSALLATEDEHKDVAEKVSKTQDEFNQFSESLKGFELTISFANPIMASQLDYTNPQTPFAFLNASKAKGSQIKFVGW